MNIDRLRELSNQTDSLDDIHNIILYLKSAQNSPDIIQRLTIAEQLITKLTTKVNLLAESAIKAAETATSTQVASTATTVATSAAAATAAAAAVAASTAAAAATIAAAEAVAIAKAITTSEI
jgi:hypothetical protein